MSVSVVMATHNRRAYVAQAIESVLQQRNTEYELIILDDASTDGTWEIISRYANHKRVRIVRHDKPEGIMFSRNKGLEMATYDLVAPMDDDDVMHPMKLHRQIEFLERNRDISVVSSWAYVINETGRIIGKSCPIADVERGTALLKPELFLELIQPATMYRKQDILHVGGYRTKLLEDRDLWGRLVTGGFKVAVQPEFLLYQRRHSQSLMSDSLSSLCLYGDFIDFNVILRLSKHSEVSFEQYLQHLKSLPLADRIKAAMSRKSKAAFRRATTSYSGHAWLAFALNLSVALALEPFSTLKRLKGKYVWANKRVE